MRVLCPHCQAWFEVESEGAEFAACLHCHQFVQLTREATHTAVQIPPTPEATSVGDATGAFRPPFNPLPQTRDSFPEVIGNYRITGVLGRGGMGVVLRGRHENTGHDAAIKTVTAANPALLQGIRREVLALSQLRHPGLVQIHDMGLDASLPWFAMELLEGATLAGELSTSRLRSRSEVRADEPTGQLTVKKRTTPREPIEPDEESPESTDSPWSWFLNSISRLCSTLAYLHGEGVIHRDLKPANIFLRADWKPVLVDFGLASRLVQQGREKLDGVIHGGTPAYMAPEQIRGEDPDARSDLYALGCILYRIVTGRPPFDTSNTTRLFHSHLHETPIPPRELVADVPPELDELILKLLAKKPGDRVGYAKDVVGILRKCGAEHDDWLERWPGRDYLYRPGFVGRQALLKRLSKIVVATQDTGGCVFIRGESGVGKTRLVMELIRQLAATGTSVFTGECVPISTSREDGFQVRANPLHPFRSLLQGITELAESDIGQGFETLTSRAARVLAVVEPSLRTLVTHREVETNDGNLRQSLLEALGSVVESFARRSPCVIVLDDLQWADELSLSFLTRYAAGEWRRSGLAIVATYRSEEAETLAPLLATMPDAQVISVDRFDEEEVGEIVRHMLADQTSDVEFVQFLAKQSEGNPFFIAEYLRAALAEKLLHREADGRWRIKREAGTDYEAVPLPATLRQLVTGRLHDLPPVARVAIEFASVIGREVDGELLQTTAHLLLHEYLEAIHILIRRQVLEEREPDQFRFIHDKLREVTYDGIPLERRRELHRTVAQGIEQLYAGNEGLEAAYSTLAHHWRTVVAGKAPDPLDVEQALHYLEKGVQQTLLNGAPHQAVEFGRAAAHLLGVDLPIRLSDIQAALGEELSAVTEQLNRMPFAELLKLPPCDSPNISRAINMLLSIHPASHAGHQFELFALMAAKNMRLTLQHGRTPTTPCVFAMYSIVTRVTQELRKAHEIGRLAIEMDRQTGGNFSTIVWFIHIWFINHWINPMRESLPLSESGARIGLQSGEILYGCYNTAAHACLHVVAGSPLSEVITTARRNYRTIGGRVAVAAFHCVNELQAAKALAGLTANLQSLDDDEFNEVRDMEPMLRSENHNQIGTYHIVRMRLAFYDRDFATVERHAALAAPNLPTFMGQISEIEFRLFGGLTLIELYTHVDASMPEEYFRRIHDCLTIFRDWSALCPTNFEHMRLMLEAGLARCEGDTERAVLLYDEASRIALEHGFMNHAPLALELAGELQIARGKRTAGRERLMRARAGYASWGANGKATTMVFRIEQMR